MDEQAGQFREKRSSQLPPEPEEKKDVAFVIRIDDRREPRSLEEQIFYAEEHLRGIRNFEKKIRHTLSRLREKLAEANRQKGNGDGK